jgi:GTP-binding protein Era
MASGKRLLRVALLGLPNSGKSTLCNALVGEEVTIATPKRHTTRDRVHAIFVDAPTQTQVVLSDTPGVLELDRESRRERSRNPGAFLGIKGVVPDALRDAQLHLLVVDAAATDSAARAEHTGRELSRLRALGAPLLGGAGGGEASVLLALNKVDRLHDSESRTRRLVAQLARACGIPAEDVLPLSARTGDGVGALRARLLAAAAPGEWAFSDPAQRTDQTLGERALEALRAEVHNALHRQLPYAVRREGAQWSEDAASGALTLEVELSMPGHSELAVLRSALGSIHRATVPRLATLFDRRVQLVLHARSRSARG